MYVCVYKYMYVFIYTERERERRERERDVGPWTLVESGTSVLLAQTSRALDPRV